MKALHAACACEDMQHEGRPTPAEMALVTTQLVKSGNEGCTCHLFNSRHTGNNGTLLGQLEGSQGQGV